MLACFKTIVSEISLASGFFLTDQIMSFANLVLVALSTTGLK